jgi:hypothetical protein
LRLKYGPLKDIPEKNSGFAGEIIEVKICQAAKIDYQRVAIKSSLVILVI